MDRKSKANCYFRFQWRSLHFGGSFLLPLHWAAVIQADECVYFISTKGAIYSHDISTDQEIVVKLNDGLDHSMSTRNGVQAAYMFNNDIIIIWGIQNISSQYDMKILPPPNCVRVWDTQNMSWKNESLGLPTVRPDCSTTVMNGKVVFLCGSTCGVNSNEVQVWDGTRLYKSQPLPEASSNMSVTVYSNKIIVMGGKNMGTAVWCADVAEVIDEATSFNAHSIWRLLPDVLYESSRVCVIDGVLLALNGQARSVHAYCEPQQKWLFAQSLPEQCSQPIYSVHVLSNGELFVVCHEGYCRSRSTGLAELVSPASANVLQVHSPSMVAMRSSTDEVNHKGCQLFEWSPLPCVPEEVIDVVEVDRSAVCLSISGNLYVLADVDRKWNASGNARSDTKTLSSVYAGVRLGVQENQIAILGETKAVKKASSTAIVLRNTVSVQETQQSNTKFKKWDPWMNKWRYLPTMLVECNFHCIVCTGRKVIIAIGGEGLQDSLLNDVQIWDGQKWYKGPSLPMASYNVSGAVYGDEVVIAGGYEMDRDIWSARITDLTCSDLIFRNSNVWKKLPEVPHCPSAVCVVDGVLVAIGRSTERDEKGPSIFCLNKSATLWSHVGNLPFKCLRVKCISFSPGEVLCFDLGPSKRVARGLIKKGADLLTGQVHSNLSDPTERVLGTSNTIVRLRAREEEDDFSSDEVIISRKRLAETEVVILKRHREDAP